MKSSGSLWMIISRPLRYLFGEYPIYQGKLNLRHSIYLSSVSSTSVLTMIRVTMEGPEDVDYLVCSTSLVNSSILMGWDLSGSYQVTCFRCFRDVLVCFSPESSPIYLSRRILSSQYVIPLYPSFSTSGIVIGG